MGEFNFKKQARIIINTSTHQDEGDYPEKLWQKFLAQEWLNK